MVISSQVLITGERQLFRAYDEAVISDDGRTAVLMRYWDRQRATGARLMRLFLEAVN